jgi:cystathionine beta-lyase/cystathionine gamma-synthase
MPRKPADICPQQEVLPPQPTEPAAAPLYTASVYRCSSPEQASQLLSGELHGYVYSRDGHPNADMLAAKCRELHGAERAAICGSGMSALAVALLSQAAQGDHVVVSSQLYGRSIQLLTSEAARLGISSTVVDTCDLAATEAAVQNNTKLIVVETITNPLVRVSDLAALAALAKKRDVRLLVDNTFASPTICRPLDYGADLALESLTKIMSGHSDVLLGLLCGREACWQRVPVALSAWGLSSSPFDCWTALRGLGTLAVRYDRAASNALAAARYLCERKEVEKVFFPGLPHHPDHELARRQFGTQFGTIVTFTLCGGLAAAAAFIAAAKRIPFCPSLGDLSTTLSHPASTSHRLMSAEARRLQGIDDGMIRLSAGIESESAVLEALDEALRVG